MDFPKGQPIGFYNQERCNSVSVTLGNGAYGSYAELIAATARESQWLVLQVNPVGYATTRAKIGVGSAGSEVTVFEVELDGHTGSSSSQPIIWIVPLTIPKGSRVAAAAWGASTYVIKVAVILIG